jgi:hypothetical protein
MLDYASYITAQRVTGDLALSALPDAPVVPFTERAPLRRRLRRQAALALFRLAGRLQPV